MLDDEKVFIRIETGEYSGHDIERYQYDNHLGSACLELDRNGMIISYEEYHPFGTTSYRSRRDEIEVSLKRYKYNGKERDEETGLYYYGARYYAPWLCRFISVDPLQYDYPNKTPYHYCSNNPVNRIDSSGMSDNEHTVPPSISYNYRNADEVKYGTEDGIPYVDVTNYSHIEFNITILSEGVAQLEGQATFFTGRAILDTSTGLPNWEMVSGNFFTETVSGSFLESDLNAYFQGIVDYSNDSNTGDILSKSSAVLGAIVGVAEGNEATFRLTDSKGMFDYKFYTNGWTGNQWVTPTTVAKVGNVVKWTGRAAGLLSIGFSASEFSQATTTEEKIEHGFNVFMGGIGFIPVIGSGISLYWSFGGKKLHSMWTENVLKPQMEMGIHHYPSVQPFK